MKNKYLGKSKFIILYHRSPFDEGTDKEGKQIWLDQKSPNGIIPTLRNLFRTQPNGTWIAWRKVEASQEENDERMLIENPAEFTLRRIPLKDDEISSSEEDNRQVAMTLSPLAFN